LIVSAQFNEQLRLETEHVDTLAQVLHEEKERRAASEQDRQFALENVARLEEKVRQRDAELAESAQRIVQREVDAEQLREQMSDMKRQHARVVDEHVRALQETTGQVGEARRHLEALIKDRAGAVVVMETLRGQANQLKDEVERLRRQVQVLQQESADKEVKIVQITKQRAQDQDDLHGLNIALNSKQQELELVSSRPGSMKWI
jgi:chromosome segregation ATPase